MTTFVMIWGFLVACAVVVIIIMENWPNCINAHMREIQFNRRRKGRGSGRERDRLNVVMVLGGKCE